MPSISPITEKLNYSARKMIETVAKNEPSKTTHIRDFFRIANDNNMQGSAVVSYFTELNKAKYGKKSPIAEMMYGFSERIEKEIKAVPELKILFNNFSNEIMRKYPRTYDIRRSLAAQEAVIADKVQPKSRFKKFLVSFNKFLSVLSDTSQ